MHYTVHITDWNTSKSFYATREASIESNEVYPARVARQIIEKCNVCNGSCVRFAKVVFDPTLDGFKIVEFAFTVKGNNPYDVTTIQA